jgi:nucleoid-associated protein YgaU
VIAGVAPPGWTVRVETPDRLIGKVKAGFDGSWVLLPDAPLPAGDHSLQVSAQAPDGSQTIRGTQRVAISVSPETAPAMVALSQDSQPTRILQSGQTAAVTESISSASQQSVAFSAVDYEDEEAAGRLYLSGTAAPGARIALYLDNRFIGSTTTDVDGSWAFSVTDILDAGQHQLRADHVDMDGGDVLSRAEVRFNPDAVAVASVQGGEVRMARAGDAESIGQEQRLSKPLAEGLATQTETASVAAIETEEPPKEAIVVKRGDTLWHIAEEHYGSGVRYTKIYRNNRDQIRNPHRIYPGQEFNLPQ